MPETPAIKKARGLITRSGLPLELRVAQAFMRHRARVTHADFYRDPVDEVTRELDVVADLAVQVGPDFQRQEVLFRLVAECKGATDEASPWLILHRPEDTTYRAQTTQFLKICPHTGRDISACLPDLHDAPLLAPDRRYGYQVVEAGPEEPTGPPVNRKAASPYNATRQAAAAAWAQVINSQPLPNHQLALICLPVVVTSRSLVWASMNDDGEMMLEEADQPALLVSRQWDSGGRPRPLWICNSKQVALLAQQAEQTAAAISRQWRRGT